MIFKRRLVSIIKILNLKREDLHISEKRYTGYSEKQSVSKIAGNKNPVFTLLYHL